MNNLPSPEQLFIWLVLSLFKSVPFIAVGIIIAVVFYDKIQMIWGDFLALIGKSSKFIRKQSIQSTMEGNLNTFAKKINSELDELIIPRVKVEFVNSKNVESFINDGTPIIRMNFGRNNNQNISNAAMAYVNTALIDKAKPYIDKDILDAINCSVARRILTDYKRGEALSYFDDTHLDPRIKSSIDFESFYSRTEEINDAGLLSRILLREYKYFGEKLRPKKASTEHSTEARQFFEYVYDIAIRKKDERTELWFKSDIIRVSVVLVSKLETFAKYGISPYLRRIKLLAGQGTRSFYLLARGDKHELILQAIAREIKQDQNFHHLSSKRFRLKGQLIYFVSFEVDYDGLAAKTKELLRISKEANSYVDATVTKVNSSSVEVDVEGLLAIIPLKELSSREVSNAQHYFSLEDELKVKVLSVEDNIIVSNKGSETDPILSIEKNYTTNQVFKATIQEIKDAGLVVVLDDGMGGFVPSSQATFSRFENLKEIYNISQSLNVTPINYNLQRQSLVLRIADLEDPWKNRCKEIKNGDTVNFKAWSIEPKKILGEVFPGAEAILLQSDWDWGIRDVNSLNIKVGDEIKAKIKEINHERRSIILSRKDFLTNPVKKFYDENYSKTLSCKIIGVDKALLNVDFGGGITGKIHISEVDWGFINNLGKIFPVDRQLDVKLLKFEERFNTIWASRKALLTDPIQEVQRKYSQGSTVKGKIQSFEPWGAKVLISGIPSEVECAITKSEVTNLCFISDLKKVFDFETEYIFLIKAIIPEKRRLILTRKLYFEKVFNANQFEYGKSYRARIIGKSNTDLFVIESGDSFQAIIVDVGKKKLKIGDTVEVHLASIDSNKHIIEVVA